MKMKDTLKSLEISQSQFGRLVGASSVTVNRWCCNDRRYSPPTHIPLILECMTHIPNASASSGRWLDASEMIAYNVKHIPKGTLYRLLRECGWGWLSMYISTRGCRPS